MSTLVGWSPRFRGHLIAGPSGPAWRISVHACAVSVSVPPGGGRAAHAQQLVGARARELGVSPQSLRNWARQIDIDKGRRDGLSCEEREELRRLRRENRILVEERAILKN